jgi:DNA repair photolyase
MRAVPLANPPNPWASTEVEYLEAPPPEVKLEVYEDHSRAILAKNDSPDVGFTWSVNPYRGCFHACAYCYARPSHEYLSFRAGTDFDRKIVVKPRAPELLSQALGKKSWRKQMICFSGVTDCYQPLEASYQLTRRCLEVCVGFSNPVCIITKAPLVERDIDVLQALTARAEVSVTVSVPFWDAEKARAIEPYVATPQRRLRTIERLARAGIDVGVNVAPIIPGLSDEDMPRVLKAAADAGAKYAGMVLLRLPGSVKAVFEERLRAAYPARADRVLHRIRETRGGELYDPRFGVRGRGEGPYSAAIQALFRNTAQRLGLSVSCHAADPVQAAAVAAAPETSPGPRQPQPEPHAGPESTASPAQLRLRF